MTLSYAVAALVAMTASSDAQSHVVWKWVPEATCKLRQQLSERRSIEIGRTPTSTSTGITFTDADASARAWQPLEGVELALEPGGKFVGLGGIGPDDRSSRSIHVSINAPEFPQQLSGTSRLTVSHASFGSVQHEVRSAGAAVQALQRCEQNKMREWSIDPDQFASLRSPPIPLSPTYQWFSTDDYPGIAAIYRVGGLVIAKVDIGEDGRVKGCTVVNKQAVTEFHAAVCRALTKRGRFKPAIGAAGEPVSAPYIVQVRFEVSR